MTWYLDASVLLRFLLRHTGFVDITSLDGDFSSSELLQLECRRALIRYRLTQEIDDEKFLALTEDLNDLFSRITFLALGSEILQAGATNWGVVIGSLDSIHLATALRCRETGTGTISILTHDVALSNAARVNGFQVMGV